MNLIKERYAIAPQLRDYDNLPSDWRPYTMFSQYPNYVSESVNTDDIGQRFTTLKNGDRLNISTIKGKCDLIIGSSAVFGVGATNDKFSIASLLSNSGERQVISLSGRAYNSRQELLLFIEYMLSFEKIENVIIMSGANNLYLSSFQDRHGTPFFWSKAFYDISSRMGLSREKLLLATFFDLFGFKDFDWLTVNKSSLTRKLFDSFMSRSDYQKNFLIDVPAAIERTIQDLNIFKELSKSIGFNLTFCLQPVGGWLQKPLVEEERILFESTLEQNHELMTQFCMQSTYEKYKTSILESCKKNGINFHDFNSSIEVGEEWFFVDRLHMTDLGYAHIAKYIQHNILYGCHE